MVAKWQMGAYQALLRIGEHFGISQFTTKIVKPKNGPLGVIYSFSTIWHPLTICVL